MNPENGMIFSTSLELMLLKRAQSIANEHSTQNHRKRSPPNAVFQHTCIMNAAKMTFLCSAGGKNKFGFLFLVVWGNGETAMFSLKH